MAALQFRCKRYIAGDVRAREISHKFQCDRRQQKLKSQRAKRERPGPHLVFVFPYGVIYLHSSYKLYCKQTTSFNFNLKIVISVDGCCRIHWQQTAQTNECFLESRRQDRTVLGMDMDMGCGIWDMGCGSGYGCASVCGHGQSPNIVIVIPLTWLSASLPLPNLTKFRETGKAAAFDY